MAALLYPDFTVTCSLLLQSLFDSFRNINCKAESMYVHHFKVILQMQVAFCWCSLSPASYSPFSSLQLVQQWPQVQKSVSKDTEEEDDAGGINLDKAKERLQEEDKFDKEEYRKKIKAKYRVSFLS